MDRVMRCVSQNLIDCCSTVETNCTTNWRNAVKGVTADWHVVNSHDSLHTSSTVDEFCWQQDRRAMSKVWDKVPEGSTLVFWPTRISLHHSVGWLKEASTWKNQLNLLSRFDTLMARHRHTDDSKHSTSIASHSKTLSNVLGLELNICYFCLKRSFYHHFTDYLA